MAKASTKKKAEVSANLLDILVAPIVTEKSTIAGSLGKYTFKVATCATKTDVKNAVESIFGVNVTKVNTVNYDGKTKLFRGREGTRNAYKKAVVTLKSGESIDLTNGIKI